MILIGNWYKKILKRDIGMNGERERERERESLLMYLRTIEEFE